MIETSDKTQEPSGWRSDELVALEIEHRVVAIRESPDALDALELVVIAAGRNQLQRQIAGRLVHGVVGANLRPVRLRVDLDDRVADNVLGARRAARVDPDVSAPDFEQLGLAGEPLETRDLDARVAEERRSLAERAAVHELAIAIEQIGDRNGALAHVRTIGEGGPPVQRSWKGTRFGKGHRSRANRRQMIPQSRLAPSVIQLVASDRGNAALAGEGDGSEGGEPRHHSCPGH